MNVRAVIEHLLWRILFCFPLEIRKGDTAFAKVGVFLNKSSPSACATAQACFQNMNERENTWQLLVDLRSLPCLWAAQSTESQYRSKEVPAYGTLANKHGVGMVEVEKKMTGVKNALSRRSQEIVGFQPHIYCRRGVLNWLISVISGSESVCQWCENTVGKLPSSFTSNVCRCVLSVTVPVI